MSIDNDTKMSIDNDNDTKMAVEHTKAETTMIKLRSMADKDGNTKVFEISKAAAKLSDLLCNAPGMDDDDEDDDDDDDVDGSKQKPPLEIEVSRVNARNLEKVVEYLNHYYVEPMNEIPTPLGAKTFEEVRFVAVARFAARIYFRWNNGFDCI